MAEKDTRELSVQGVKRLPYYLKYLKELEASNTPYVPAAAIADSLGIYEVQVRKDLAAVSSSGGRPSTRAAALIPASRPCPAASS